MIAARLICRLFGHRRPLVWTEWECPDPYPGQRRISEGSCPWCHAICLHSEIVADNYPEQWRKVFR